MAGRNFPANKPPTKPMHKTNPVVNKKKSKAAEQISRNTFFIKSHIKILDSFTIYLLCIF